MPTPTPAFVVNYDGDVIFYASTAKTCRLWLEEWYPELEGLAKVRRATAREWLRLEPSAAFDTAGNVMATDFETFFDEDGLDTCPDVSVGPIRRNEPEPVDGTVTVELEGAVYAYAESWNAALAYGLDLAIARNPANAEIRGFVYVFADGEVDFDLIDEEGTVSTGPVTPAEAARVARRTLRLEPDAAVAVAYVAYYNGSPLGRDVYVRPTDEAEKAADRVYVRPDGRVEGWYWRRRAVTAGRWPDPEGPTPSNVY